MMQPVGCPEIMYDSSTKGSELNFVALAADYCAAVEQPWISEEKETFVARMLLLLPRIYLGISEASSAASPDFVEGEYFAEYVDEEMYENVRKNVAALLGEEDTYLETFEQDMKYSETPIAASISEGLADLYQNLYNFVRRVRDSDGEALSGALLECKEDFGDYWSQTLCNVFRALNAIRYPGA